MRGGFYGPGFGLTGTEVIFPVSTRLAVVGAFELKEAVIDVGEDAVAGINGGQPMQSAKSMLAIRF